MHLARVEAAAFFVAAALQRGDGAVDKLRSLIEHLRGQIAVGVRKRRQRLPPGGRLQHLGQQELDVGEGLACWHGLLLI